MSFITKEWKDRIVEYAGRRRLTNVSTQAQEIVDVERAEGTVSQAGDAFNAANMNDLEQRISDEFTAVNENLTAVQNDSIRYPDYTNCLDNTTLHGNVSTTYTATQNCWLIGGASGGSESPEVKVNNIKVFGMYMQRNGSIATSLYFMIPLKVGDVVTTRSGNEVNYYIDVYGVR